MAMSLPGLAVEVRSRDGEKLRRVRWAGSTCLGAVLSELENMDNY